MATKINVYTTEKTESIIRFFRDDRTPNSDRIDFIQADYVRHLMIHRDLPYEIHHHDDSLVTEVVESFENASGIQLPEEFVAGTSIYNVPAVLMNMGIQVPFRVLRQQIFIGGSVAPIVPGQTEHNLFHALGNALWNYLDYNVWGNQNDKKNEYRKLRGIELIRNRSKSHKHQDSLFYIAAEDFRYLFGTINAGKGEWYLKNMGMQVGPPHVEAVGAFWRREIETNGNRVTEASNLPATP